MEAGQDEAAVIVGVAKGALGPALRFFTDGPIKTSLDFIFAIEQPPPMTQHDFELVLAPKDRNSPRPYVFHSVQEARDWLNTSSGQQWKSLICAHAIVSVQLKPTASPKP